MSDDLEIRVCGELEVRRGGAAVDLPPSKKTRALLAYLAVTAAPQRRERLCELFWQVPDDPRGALRWSLSKLRPLVNGDDAERVAADRERVAFDACGARVDSRELADVCTRLETASTAELARLADGFRGPALEGLDLPHQPEFEAWRLAVREEVGRNQARVLTALAERLQAADPNAAAARLRQQIALDPHDAAAHVRLIALLASCGRRDDAVRQHGVSRKILDGVDAYDPAVFKAALQADVRPKDRPAAPPPEPETDLRQEIRFCTSPDGVRLAYATVGSGPPLVKCANWLNHLEFDWESPIWRHIFRAFAADFTFIRYDSRGNGLSDWEVGDFSFDTLVTDLETVVDAAGVERFPLLGISQGCAVSVEYAVRHPERVTKLVLYGGYARGWRVGTSEAFVESQEAMMTLMRGGWGQNNPAFRQMFTSFFIPEATVEETNWFNELQRMTTSPLMATKLMAALGVVDVTHRLAEVKVPALVVHARDDARVAYARGRELATGIPNARFVTLEGKNHLPLEHDAAWPRFLEEVRAFLLEP